MHHDGGARGGEPQRDPAAQAPGGAGDQGDLTTQIGQPGVAGGVVPLRGFPGHGRLSAVIRAASRGKRAASAAASPCS